MALTFRPSFGPGVELSAKIRKVFIGVRILPKSTMPRPSKVDIHDYDKKYLQAKRAIDRAKISQRNKELIHTFERATFLKEALSQPRRIRILQALVILARNFAPCDFDEMDKPAVEEMVIKLDNTKRYSIWTKQSYRSVIKKFFKWLKQGDDYAKTHGYPAIVSWINTNVKKKDKPRVKAADLLTEEEIQALINCAQHPRDKAFLSMLYELGARIGEIGGILIKDVTRDKYGYIVDLSGKTGHRTPRIVMSGPYISAWLKTHPMRNKPDAPMWVLKAVNKHMEYSAFRSLLLRAKDKAGISKRLYPHLFRHTRVTHLLLNKEINEAQAKVYFGWVPDSKMLSEYSHLMSSDVNDAILEVYGIKKRETEESKLKPKQCPRCEAINEPDARFCSKCACILDVSTALDLDEERRSSDDMMAELMSNPEVQRILTKTAVKMGFKEKLLEAIEPAKSS